MPNQFKTRSLILTRQKVTTTGNMLYVNDLPVGSGILNPSGVMGSGTINYVPKFVSFSGIGNSQISDNKHLVSITGSVAATSGFVTGIEVHDKISITSLSGFLDRQDIQARRVDQRGVEFVEIWGKNGFGTSIRFSSYNPSYPDISGSLVDEFGDFFVDEFASNLQI